MRRSARGLFSAALIMCAALASASGCAAEHAVVIPPPAFDSPKSEGAVQTAVLGGGCFWGVQAVFEHLNGVRQVISGYSGGSEKAAEYEAVSGGDTGHAESVEITFDPKQVTYGEILHVFFSVTHDPTQLNRQGPDTGTQYRSVIFYANDMQKRIATEYIAQLNKAKVFRAPIVTRVDPLQGFFAAEDYHQDFLLKNPNHPYIVINDVPKVRNFQKTLPALYQGTPVRVTAAKQ